MSFVALNTGVYSRSLARPTGALEGGDAGTAYALSTRDVVDLSSEIYDDELLAGDANTDGSEPAAKQILNPQPGTDRVQYNPRHSGSEGWFLDGSHDSVEEHGRNDRATEIGNHDQAWLDGGLTGHGNDVRPGNNDSTTQIGNGDFTSFEGNNNHDIQIGNGNDDQTMALKGNNRSSNGNIFLDEGNNNFDSVGGNHNHIHVVGDRNQSVALGNHNCIEDFGNRDNSQVVGNHDRVTNHGSGDTTNVDSSQSRQYVNPGNNDRVTVNGNHDRTTVNGNNDRITVEGTHRHVSVDGSGIRGTLNKKGQFVNSKGHVESGVRVHHSGNTYTIRHAPKSSDEK